VSRPDRLERGSSGILSGVIGTLLAEAPGWLAVDKPPGLPVIPARSEDPGHSLWRALESERAERLWVVHRIDRGTSGVVLFARDAATHRVFSSAFERREIRKGYLALTRGVPDPLSGTIDLPLHPARKGKMRPAAPGEAGALIAATEYAVFRRWNSSEGPIALVELFPRTGRQHQLRVHLRALGTPLLVDRLYGSPRPVLGLERLALHAASITFPDPVTRTPETVEAPLAPDLAALIERLDRGAAPETNEPPG
jgi:tRNA pseudouridine32 synthase/23S rRNA pseudouridine746 synthase